MEAYSVLLTVYRNDDPSFFALALDSMIGQSLPPDEIVVVNDGPIPDPLQQVIDSRLHAGAPVVQVPLPVNKGLGLALNAGLAVVRNDLVARMDADDYSLPERCEKQVRAFEEDPELAVISCPVLEFSGSIDHIVGRRDVPKTNEEIYRFAKKRDPFNHPAVMYRKSAVEAAGCYADLRKNQDTDLWIRMLKNGVRCRNLEEPLLRFRFDEGTYRKRKSWVNTKILIGIRYRAWKSGFNTFGEFLAVAAAQMGVYLLPESFQRFLYRKVLRRAA